MWVVFEISVKSVWEHVFYLAFLPTFHLTVPPCKIKGCLVVFVKNTTIRLKHLGLLIQVIAGMHFSSK